MRMWRLDDGKTIRHTVDPSELARFVRTHGVSGVTEFLV
jgi:hypothetical protein